MRMLAGFEIPDAGDILLDGVSLAGQPPHRRPVNMMFQSYALFPHMRVAENIAFGLKQEGLPKHEIARRVEELLQLVKLAGFQRRKTSELSGGQRQRVALARALAKRPKILLLDEPLSALDRKLREATQHELKDLQRRLGMTFLMVTHDQEEAMTLADRIGVMDHGRLIQVAPPRDLYEAPFNRQIAEFVGDANIIEAQVSSIGQERLIASWPAGTLHIRTTSAHAVAGDHILLALRPENIRISCEEPNQTINKVRGEVSGIRYFGGSTMFQIEIAKGQPDFKVTIANTVRGIADPAQLGETVWLIWDAKASILLKE